MKNKVIRIVILSILFLILILPKNEFAVSEFTLGDVNADSIIDRKDVISISRHISAVKNKKYNEWILKREKFESADINRDGFVNVADIMMMLRYFATRSNPYNIGIIYQTRPKLYNTLIEEENNNDENQSENNQQNFSIRRTLNLEEATQENPISFNEIQNEIQGETQNETQSEINSEKVAVNIMQERLESSNHLRFEKDGVVIKTNEVEKLKIITENNADPISLTTSDTNIVELYGVGLALGKNPGEAIITAEQGNEKAQCKVIVVDRNEAVYNIEIDKKEVKLEIGETTKLEAKTEPANKEVKWISNNSNIAEVKQDGTIIGKKAGKVGIVAISGEKSAMSIVTVKDKEVLLEEIAINKKEEEITQGEDGSLMVGIAPKNATIKEIEVLIDNDNIQLESNKVQVNDDGYAEIKFQANKVGTTTLVAKAGEKEARCKVKILEAVVDKISLDTREIKMLENQLRRITVNVEPEIARNAKITWTSSNNEVAVVDENGLLTSKKQGEAIITATTGGKSASCKVIVEKAVESIREVRIPQSLTVKEEAEVKVAIELLPANAKSEAISLELNNNNASMVNGKVIADENGRAEITIKGNKAGKSVLTVNAGSIVEKCEITIIPKEIPVSKITLSSSNIEIDKGKTAKITVKIEPLDATNNEITLKTNNSNISINNTKVTTGSDGTAQITITGSKEGNATLTATSGKQSVSCKVKVNAVIENVSINYSSIEIVNGKTKTLTATVTPSSVTDKNVTWSSSNTKVATVDKNGKVTAKSEGTATITATASNGKKGTCSVKVKGTYLGFESDKIDSLYYIQSGKRRTADMEKFPSDVPICAHSAMTCCINILTGDFSINPYKFYQSCVKKYGAKAMTGSSTGPLITAMAEQYGLKQRRIKSGSSELSAEGAKNILKNGGCLWVVRGKDLKFYKPDGTSPRTHPNSHCIMFYKYKDGYFYAKDDAHDGGAMCKYPESYMTKFLSTGAWETAVIYK